MGEHFVKTFVLPANEKKESLMSWFQGKDFPSQVSDIQLSTPAANVGDQNLKFLVLCIHLEQQSCQSNYWSQ